MKLRRLLRNRQRFADGKSRSRKSRLWQYGGVLLLTVAVVGTGAYMWYTHPRTAAVSYPPCQMSYGDVVAEWDGAGDTPWDQSGYHYQLRRFQVRAEAPDVFFPRTVESPPTRIATGGEQACGASFDETVDTTSEQYRWRGSRATGLRLGLPEASPGSEAAHVPEIDAPPDGGLATPVFERSRSAAVWVDDGGSATIYSGDNMSRWWCINDQQCTDITEQTVQSGARRGAGYQYTTDNCPEAIDCTGEWYTRLSAPEIIARERGMLEPFNMRLSAVSTHADTVGTAAVVAFKYPKDTTLETSVRRATERIEPGEQFELDMSIRKRGPALDSLRITPQPADIPVAGAEPTRLNQQQLSRLNTTDSATVPLTFRIDSEGKPGRCYTLGFMLAPEEAERPLAEPEITYCIAAEETNVEYTVRTRGDTGADMNQFRSQAAATLRDQRGWAAANIVFTRVENSGDFTLWLAAANEMTGFSGGCSPEYSCRVGSNVIINDRRWRNATQTWNRAGGTLRNYRHMVINHEIGHFLGLGHRKCPADGRAAPVMMQQSIELGGCRINPWPLQKEIESVQ